MKANISGSSIRIMAENENDEALMRSWIDKTFKAGEYLVSRRPYSDWPELYLTEVKDDVSSA